MSIIDPPAGWDVVDGINTNERLLGGATGPLNRAITGATARTKYLREQAEFLAAQVGGILPRLLYATPEMFGAVGDGLTNDSAAFAELNASLALGGTMELGLGKTYRAFGLSMTNVGRMVNNGSVFKLLEEDLQVNRFVIRFGNTLPAITLTAPIAATAGSDRIPLTDQLTGVRVGDMLAFKSTTPRTWLNSELETTYYNGQYAVVVELTSTQIIFSTPIYADFPITSIEINRVPPYMVLGQIGIDVSQARNGAISVIGMLVTGYNGEVGGIRVIGNDFVSIGVQVRGENMNVTGCEIAGTLNGYGTGTARLGYAINVGGNGIIVSNNTLYNCKHGITSAPRDIVSRGIQYIGNRVCSYRRAADPPYDVAMSAFDTHSNTWDALIVEGNYIDVEGHACTFRNGKVVFNKNTVVLRGTGILSVLRDVENPCTFLRASGNEIRLGNNHTLFDISESQQPSNVLFHGNTVYGGRILWTRNPLAYDARNIKFERNTFVGIRALAEVTLGAGSLYNLEFLGNQVSYYPSATFGVRLTSSVGATGTYRGVVFDGAEKHTWEANTLSNHYGLDFSGSTFYDVKLGAFTQRIQNGVNYTPRGIIFRQSNVYGFDNRADTDSEVTFQGDAAAVTYDRINAALPGARAEGVRFTEGTAPISTTMLAVAIGPGAQLRNTRSAPCVSFNFPTTGATSWAASTTVSVAGNYMESANTTSVSANGGLSASVGAPIAVRNNVMNGSFVDSTGGYAILPLGNVTAATQAFRASTLVRPDGRVAGAAAPASRTWATGDVVYNSAPAVAAPTYWVCTAGGTPGTWVAGGTL